jgi:hypothetical protein
MPSATIRTWQAAPQEPRTHRARLASAPRSSSDSGQEIPAGNATKPAEPVPAGKRAGPAPNWHYGATGIANSYFESRHLYSAFWIRGCAFRSLCAVGAAGPAEAVFHAGGAMAAGREVCLASLASSDRGCSPLWTAPRQVAGRTMCARSDRNHRLRTIGTDERQDVGRGRRRAIPGGLVRSELANINPAEIGCAVGPTVVVAPWDCPLL